MAFLFVVVGTSECINQFDQFCFHFIENLFGQLAWAWNVAQNHTPCISQRAIHIDNVIHTCIDQFRNLTKIYRPIKHIFEIESQIQIYGIPIPKEFSHHHHQQIDSPSTIMSPLISLDLWSPLKFQAMKLDCYI